jgi:hypothetical protein
MNNSKNVNPRHSNICASQTSFYELQKTGYTTQIELIAALLEVFS